MEKTLPNHTISQRAQLILRALIDQYISDGQPVGSRTLSKQSGLKLSPATIRHVMGDLEELGLLTSPHTSAGRIPTPQGYRIFIDSLLRLQPISQEVESSLRLGLSREHSSKGMADRASSLLSGLTHMAGIVMVPRRQQSTIRHIEFLPLSGRRVLVILVFNEQEVQNRVVPTERDYAPSELEVITNYLNSQFAGKSITQVRDALRRELEHTRQDVDRLMRSAIRMAGKVFSSEARDDDEVVVAGQTNLMDFSELSDMERLKGLFDVFNQKREMVDLLERCIDAEGIQIFVGQESGYEVLDQCSVIATPYRQDGEVLGVLGVIGPTRMEYERIIPIVDVTSKILGSALNFQRPSP